jgi:acyl-CoA synthetase (AMP-forming)/AMP-acid ligase II
VTEPENPILAAWRQTLAHHAARPAIFAPSGEVLRTFEAIDVEARKLEGLLDGIAPHSVVAVKIGNSERWPELLLALWRRKLIPLPLGEMAPAELETTLRICRVRALVMSQGGTMEVQPQPGQPDDTNWPFPPPELLKLTSGTTNVPRAVRFRAGQLLADCDNICATMGITETDVNYGVIPFSHSYGFSNLVTPLLVRGVGLVVSDDRFPRAVLEGLAASGATVFPGNPVFFQKLGEIESSHRLENLRLCVSAGAPLTRQVGELFSARYGRKIHTFYGSSECGGIAYDATDALEYEDGFVGTPMQGVQIAFGDSRGGPIVVRSEAVGDGYFPDSDAAVLGGGRFVPGDIVQRTERGMYLVGRTSEIINVAGRKLNPLEVEARLAEYPGVKQAVVFGVQSALRGEEPVACVAGLDLGRDALLRFCQEHLSPWQVPRDLWLVQEIPSTERGKINRRAVAESYRAQLNKP